MNKYDEAVVLDISQKIEQAADAYEEVIELPDAPLDAYINLACLYWHSTDPGQRFTHDFFHVAGTRMWDVLDETESKYSGYPEIKFWRLYFQFTTLGEQPFVEQCLEFVKQPNCTLVPYFHLFDQTNDKVYFPKVKLLYQEALGHRTTKNRYITSILRNDMENLM